MNYINIAYNYCIGLEKKEIDELHRIITKAKLSNEYLVDNLPLGFQYSIVLFGLLQCDKEQKCVLINNKKVKSIIETINLSFPDLLFSKNYHRLLKVLTPIQNTICHQCKSSKEDKINSIVSKSINSVSSIYSMPYFLHKSNTPMMRLLFLNNNDDVILDSSSDVKDWMFISRSLLKSIKSIYMDISKDKFESLSSLEMLAQDISKEITEITDVFQKAIKSKETN